MPRVLHLNTAVGRGGTEMWLLSMLREIPRNECVMDFCCKGANVGEYAPLARQLGAQVYHCPLGPTHIPFIKGIKRILTEGQYHILHNHLGAYSGFPVWVAHRLGIPVITSFHNTQFAPQRWFTRLPILSHLRSIYATISINYALSHSDLVTGCSQAVIQRFGGDNTKTPGRSRVLYYGVNVPRPSSPEERASLRRSFGWPADAPLVLHVGRFFEQKNHLGLLSVFQFVLEHVPTARMLLVGDGRLRPEIEHTLAKHGLASTVRLLGMRDDVPSLMSKCDVFVFPSFFEGFGLVAIEANAAGLPVVGSRIPGLTEAVRDGETALLHDVEDIESMAMSAVRILTDRQCAQRLASAGRRWVRENFTVEISARRLLELYESISYG